MSDLNRKRKEIPNQPENDNDGDPDDCPKAKKSKDGEFEVGGISRSGRIRKKSSKLFDFDSVDDHGIDKKKKPELIDYNKKGSLKLKLGPSGTESKIGHNKNLDSFSMLSEDFYETEDFIDEQDDAASSSKAENEKKDLKDAKSQNVINLQAFNLWVKDAKKQVQRSDPCTNFSGVRKRLGVIWRSMPISEREKYIREVKRMNSSGSTGRKSLGLNNDSNTTSGRKAKIISTGKIKETKLLPKQSHKKLASTDDYVVDNTPSKAVETEPVDVAAHLALLGECLGNIGSRLKEHAGMVTVSGSMSVLLDSLVCSLGPLLCLTQTVPELDVFNQKMLTEILDNITYVFPGL